MSQPQGAGRKTLMSALIAGIVLSSCGTQTRPTPRWVGVGGWSLNAVVSPAQPQVHAMYAIFGNNAPSIAIRHLALGRDPNLALTTVSMALVHWPHNTREYRLQWTMSATKSLSRSLFLTVHTSHWTHTFPWGRVTIRVLPQSQTVLKPVEGTGGTQGAFLLHHLYTEVLQNNRAQPIILKGLVQAGDYTLARPEARLGQTLPHNNTIPQQARPLKNFVVPPHQKVVIYDWFMVSHKTATNVLFKPALTVQSGQQIMVQPLATTEWLTTFIPYPDVNVHVPNVSF